MSGDTTSSFYSSTPNYATDYPTQNDENSNPVDGNTQSPSSFYPDGGVYNALNNSDATLAQMEAETAQSSANAAAAAASASAAAASASDAALSDTDAQTQATNAAASATAAASSASAASSSATAASGSATAASGSATAASGSASAASSSATAASGSATAASTSATNAATSATNTQNLYNTYRSEYYGPLATDPTLDPLSNAPTVGDFYYNTASGKFRSCTSASPLVWADMVAGGTPQHFIFNATAGQTVFSGADASSHTLLYTVGGVEVIINGLMVPYTDYTATDGSTITLNTAASAGDVIYIYTLAAFNVSNAVVYTAQSLTSGDAVGSPSQQTQARENIYSAPFDALAYSGMQANGSCNVSQANGGSSIAIAAGSGNIQTIDNWVISRITSTAAITVQQVASVFPGYVNELKLTTTTAEASLGTDFIYIRQNIEGYRFARLVWGTASAQPLTIGFWAKSSLAGQLAASIQDGSANFAAVTPANVTLTANTPKFVTYTFTPPASWTGSTGNGLGAILDIHVAQSGLLNIAASVGATFEITGLIILPGIELPSASRAPFIMRPFDAELLTCQRYYRQMGPNCGLYGFANTSTSVYLFGSWYPSMRATPTVSATGVLTVDDNTVGTHTQSSVGLTANAGPNGGRFYLTNFTGLTAPGNYAINTGNSITLDARL